MFINSPIVKKISFNLQNQKFYSGKFSSFLWNEIVTNFSVHFKRYNFNSPEQDN